MDFALTDEQRMLQAHIGRGMGERATPEFVAAHIAAAPRFEADLWGTVCDFGIPGVLVPEEAGGLALGLLEAALIAEMMGRYAVPMPFMGTVIAAPLALRFAGSQEQRDVYLPRLAEGALRVGLAVSHSLAGQRGATSVNFDGRGLTGEAQFAIDMEDPEVILVADAEGHLHLVAADASGLEATRLDIVDRTRAASALNFSNVTPLETLPGQALDRLGAALRIITAADLLGAADRMVEIAVAYAKVRQQFGRPIGSFQAVKHLCADMAAEIEPCRALVWYAAYAQDEGLEDAALTALHAKALMADVARVAARNATEVHGGIGITEELRLHHWFKRISFSGQLFGGPTRLREEAARLQGLGGIRRDVLKSAAE